MGVPGVLGLAHERYNIRTEPPKTDPFKETFFPNFPTLREIISNFLIFVNLRETPKVPPGMGVKYFFFS